MKGEVDFEGKLEIGHKWQELAMRELRYKYGKLMQVEGKFKPYDLFNHNIKIEVKGEVKSIYTGNICIEYRCHGRLSGISTTKADRWVHFYNMNGWRMTDAPVDELKDFCKKYKWRKVTGGDYDGSELLIIPCKALHNKFGSIKVGSNTS